MSKFLHEKLNDSLLEACLNNHLNIDPDQVSISSGKSDLDEDYYKNQLDPIPQHILEGNCVKIDGRNVENVPRELSTRQRTQGNCYGIENAAPVTSQTWNKIPPIASPRERPPITEYSSNKKSSNFSDDKLRNTSQQKTVDKFLIASETSFNRKLYSEAINPKVNPSTKSNEEKVSVISRDKPARVFENITYKNQPDPIPQHILEGNCVKINGRNVENVPRELPTRQRTQGNCYVIQNAAPVTAQTSNKIPTIARPSITEYPSIKKSSDDKLRNTSEQNTVDKFLIASGTSFNRKLYSEAINSKVNPSNKTNEEKVSVISTDKPARVFENITHKLNNQLPPATQSNPNDSYKSSISVNILKDPPRNYPHRDVYRIETAGVSRRFSQENNSFRAKHSINPETSNPFNSTSRSSSQCSNRSTDRNITEQPSRQSIQYDNNRSNYNRPNRVPVSRNFPPRIYTGNEVPYRQFPSVESGVDPNIIASTYDNNKQSLCGIGCCMIL